MKETKEQIIQRISDQRAENLMAAHEELDKLREEHDAALRLAYARAATAEQRAEAAEAKLSEWGCMCEAGYSQNDFHELVLKLEAAEARIKEAEGQEPIAWFAYTKSPMGKIHDTKEISWFRRTLENSFAHTEPQPLYTCPLPPADVAELQKKLDEAERAIECIIAAHKIEKAAYEHRIAELERKLAEQQAVLDAVAKGLSAEGLVEIEKQELNAILAKARAEAVPEGWQVVPKELTPAITAAMVACEDGSMTIQEAWGALLAAATKSEGK